LNAAPAIGQVAHAQSDETTRYYLNGIFIHDRAGKLGLVARARALSPSGTAMSRSGMEHPRTKKPVEK